MVKQGKAWAVETQLPLWHCLYARKSTEEDDRQALAIESQVKKMHILGLCL
ncbi:MAG: hypothetical protein V1738_00330 [Patescibacteria group bacterium]